MTTRFVLLIISSIPGLKRKSCTNVKAHKSKMIEHVNIAMHVIHIE